MRGAIHQNERIMDTTQLKDGLWEDYYAGRISTQDLEEELTEIEALEKSQQP